MRDAGTWVDALQDDGRFRAAVVDWMRKGLNKDRVLRLHLDQSIEYYRNVKRVAIYQESLAERLGQDVSEPRQRIESEKAVLDKLADVTHRYEEYFKKAGCPGFFVSLAEI